MTVVSKSPESFHREGCGEVDPEFRRLPDGIHIDSDVTMINLGANDIRRLAQKTIFSPGSRRAIIVSSDLVYGLGRMYEILREIAGGGGIRVFRDFDEALDWVLSKNLTA